jgi:hypothetical protein
MATLNSSKATLSGVIYSCSMNIFMAAMVQELEQVIKQAGPQLLPK